MKELLMAVSLAVGLHAGLLVAQPINYKAMGLDDVPTFGESDYRLDASRAYHRHARDHVRLMRDRLDRNEPWRREVHREHARAVRANLEHADMHQKRFEEPMMKDPQMKQIVTDVKDHSTKVQLASEMLVKETEKEKPDPSMISKCCDEIEKELSMIDKMEEKLAAKIDMDASKHASTSAASARVHSVAKPVASK